MREKLSKKEMSDQRNIRDHKRRLLAAKYELRRKLYKAFCKDSDLPSDMRDKLRYKLSKLPINSSFARNKEERSLFPIDSGTPTGWWGTPIWMTENNSYIGYRLEKSASFR
ncbi:hypothetical protein JHK87_012268 [Glycine soja]|nr:hypothetical protein JHK87_012268 [Glycine soja]